MRESRPYGSVRGALSDERPYRVNGAASACGTFRKWLIWLTMSGHGGEADLAVTWVEVKADSGESLSIANLAYSIS